MESKYLRFIAQQIAVANKMASPTREQFLVGLIEILEETADNMDRISSPEWQGYQRQIAENLDRPNGGLIL